MQPYPFDLTGLERGTYLSREDICALMPEVLEKTDREYDWFLLSLREKIEKDFMNRGDAAWVKTENGGLRILLDPEQSDWLDKQIIKDIRAAKKAFLFLRGVRKEELTPEQQQVHERRLITNSRYMQAVHKAEQEIKQMELERRRRALDP